MNQIAVSPLLRRALAVDAGASIVFGIALGAFAGPLQHWLRLPQSLLFGAGLVALGYGLVLSMLCRRRTLAVAAVWSIVIGNLFWAGACVVLAFAGWLAPSPAGVGFLLLQAAAVIALADLQYLGLRRGHPSGSAFGQA
jgi:hypothetical protein